MARRLSARQVRRLRRRIAWIGFCDLRPGLLHDWQPTEYPDPSSFGAVITVSECTKCASWRWD